MLNQWLDAGCSVVSAQATGEVAVVLNCKAMVETMRKSGRLGQLTAVGFPTTRRALGRPTTRRVLAVALFHLRKRGGQLRPRCPTGP